MKLKIREVAFLLAVLVGTIPATAQDQRSAITVFTAKKIVTMDPTRPTANAIAVREGRILGVGSLQDLAPWLKDNKYTINDQFQDRVLMPGMIDPHLHPLLGAVAFQTVWITPEPWNVMGEKTPATIGQDAYRKALEDAVAGRQEDLPIFMTWGYSADTHGDLSGDLLDGISREVPILVLHRSMHEIYINTPMLELLKTRGLDADR